MEATSFYLGIVCGLVFLALISNAYAVLKNTAKLKELETESRLQTLSAAEHTVRVYDCIEKIEKELHGRIDETQKDLRFMGEQIIDALSENLNTVDKDIRSEIDSRFAKLEPKPKTAPKKSKMDIPLNS